MGNTAIDGEADRGGVVCVGNFIVDRIHTLGYWPSKGSLAHILHQEIGLGGGAANVASDLVSLGFEGRLAAVGAVGDDGDGHFIRETISGKGIDADGIVMLQETSTAHTHVMNVPGEGRTFFYHGGANDRFTPALFDPAPFAAQGYRFLYLGYLMLMPGLDALGETDGSGAARLLSAARTAGLVTVVDFVSSEDPAFADKVRSSLPFCDYLVINETEAGRAAGIAVRTPEGRLDEACLCEAARALLGIGVNRAVVVHAPETCLWCAPGAPALLVPSRPVDPARIVSAVGAGDAFCASVIYGLYEGWPPEKITRMAHRVAACSLSGRTATDGIPVMADLLRDEPA